MQSRNHRLIRNVLILLILATSLTVISGCSSVKELEIFTKEVKKTPLNIDYQIQAIKSLRKGIEDYDRRHGWRGPITNKLKNGNWKNKIDEFKLDPTLKWKFAEILEKN